MAHFTLDSLQVVIGFILTTVVGGALVQHFQNRAWEHQHNVSLFDSDRQIASSVFESVSVVIDRRIYRMRQLRWRLEETPLCEADLSASLDDYRYVLFEWNDNLNRNSALVQRYFGADVRIQLEDIVYESFSQIGKNLEQCYRNRHSETFRASLLEIESDLNSLSDSVYILNLAMIRMIQEGTVGLKSQSSHHSKIGVVQQRRLAHRDRSHWSELHLGELRDITAAEDRRSRVLREAHESFASDEAKQD